MKHQPYVCLYDECHKPAIRWEEFPRWPIVSCLNCMEKGYENVCPMTASPVSTPSCHGPGETDFACMRKQPLRREIRHASSIRGIRIDRLLQRFSEHISHRFFIARIDTDRSWTLTSDSLCASSGTDDFERAANKSVDHRRGTIPVIRPNRPNPLVHP